MGKFFTHKGPIHLQMWTDGGAFYFECVKANQQISPHSIFWSELNLNWVVASVSKD